MAVWKQTDINARRFRRVFEQHVEDTELVWHRDRKNRTVQIIQSDGWKYQADNQIPVEIKPGDTLCIAALEYHRIIKGRGDLIVEIIEH